VHTGTKALTLAHCEIILLDFYFLDEVDIHILLDEKGLDKMGINPAFLCLHDIKKAFAVLFHTLYT